MRTLKCRSRAKCSTTAWNIHAWAVCIAICHNAILSKKFILHNIAQTCEDVVFDVNLCFSRKFISFLEITLMQFCHSKIIFYNLWCGFGFVHMSYSCLGCGFLRLQTWIGRRLNNKFLFNNIKWRKLQIRYYAKIPN